MRPYAQTSQNHAKMNISLKHAMLHLESLMHIQEPTQVINAYSSRQDHVHQNNYSQVNHACQHTRKYN